MQTLNYVLEYKRLRIAIETYERTKDLLKTKSKKGLHGHSQDVPEHFFGVLRIFRRLTKRSKIKVGKN